MADYYTNTSEYPPVSTKYNEQSQSMPQQPPNSIQQPSIPMPQPMMPMMSGMPAGMPAGMPGMAGMPERPMLGKQYKYNNDTFNIDFKDVLKRAIKYIVEGLAVAFVAYYFISKGRLDIKDIVMLGITAAFVFAILDTFSPTISLGARFGAGFGIGQGLFGLNPTIIGPGMIGV